MPESATTALRPSRGTVLGFDFGEARIGVAVGEFETAQASALTTLHVQSNRARFDAIGALISEWQPIALVVGLPLDLEGQAQERTARCQRFANQLGGRYNLPVALVDERFTSAEAEHRLADAGKTRWQQRKPELDAAAAQIILQHYLDH